jgi:hypothetical protein
MSSQTSASTESHSPSGEKWPHNTERTSRDSDSIVSVSSADTETDHDALGKTLTARASRVSDHMSLAERVTTIPTNVTADPNFEVDWDGEDDPENPKNWTLRYKAMGLLFLSWNTLIV